MQVKQIAVIGASVMALSACGGGSGNSGAPANGGNGGNPPLPPVTAFQSIKYQVGNQQSGKPSSVSIDASGVVSVRLANGTSSADQLTAAELAQLASDATPMLSDASAFHDPSCPFLQQAGGYRSVSIVGADGKTYLVQDNKGNLCSYGGQAAHSMALLGNILGLSIRHAPALTTSWQRLQYTLDPFGNQYAPNQFNVSADGSYTVTRVWPYAQTLSGTLSAAELAQLNADWHNLKVASTSLLSCTVVTAPLSQSTSPTLSAVDNAGNTTRIIYPNGSVCGDGEQSVLLANALQSLARKALAPASSRWTAIDYYSGGLATVAMELYPQLDTASIWFSPSSLVFPKLSASEQSQLEADMNAWLNDVFANSYSAACSTHTVLVGASQPVSVSVPALGGAIPLRREDGVLCSYGNDAHAQQLLNDITGIVQHYRPQ